MKHKMRYTTKLFGFICIQVFLIFTILIFLINWNFSRQSQKYILNYNESAVHALAQRTQNQRDSFFQQINGTYEYYYSFKEGFFSKFNALYPYSFTYRPIIYQFLSEMFYSSPELAAATLYAAGDDQIYAMTKQYRRNYSSAEESFTPLISTYMDPHTILRVEPSSICDTLEISRCYSFIHCLRDVTTLENIGAIQLDYSVQKLEDFLYQNYPEVKGDFLITDSEGTVLFDTSEQWYDRSFPLTEVFSVPSFTQKEIDIDGQTFHVTMKTLSNPKLKVIGMISNKTLFNDIRQNITVMILGTCAITLLNCITIFLYLTASTKQLNRIHQAMLQTQEGNLEAYIPVDSRQKNELTEISVSYNSMLHNLNHYIDQVYKAEIDNQRYKLKMLQSQINPHFLYNTLEAIRMKAILHKEPEIGEMVYILSRIFRNSVKAEGILTVRQEIENCKNYLKLCNIQYQDLFRYEFDIQSTLLSRKIIQHALLVMIENYIMHGFDSSRNDNFICITGREENGYAVFQICDNGYGIQKEDLEKLLISIHENTLDNAEKIGIKNIYQRMRLLYGDKCDLKIHSTYGKGTQIILSFHDSSES